MNVTDTLRKAQNALQSGERCYEVSAEQGGDAYWRGRSEQAKAAAVIYAQVATAEALERIADALDKIVARMEIPY